MTNKREFPIVFPYVPGSEFGTMIVWFAIFDMLSVAF
jgi:hypothetical protein